MQERCRTASGSMNEDSARGGSLSVTPPTEGWTAGDENPTFPSGWPETTGRCIPRYRLLGPLGMGGMGVVYRAEDTRLGRTVALKFLPPTLAPNPRAEARFLDEARTASALDHPNICTIYEVGETPEGQLYLAMACYEGETLKSRLERGPLPAAEALRVVLQIAGGLAKAHRHGIVHRDIKPANLMITADGLVKILDFGIARLPGQSPAVPLLGTPGYMPPEQVRGGEVDARSDVWALGAVLYEMLTGRRPDRSPRGPISGLPQEAPRGTGRLLARLLAEEPEDRPSDAAALLADLTALERAAAGPAASPAPARWRPAVWAGVAAWALALAVAAGLWLLWDMHRTDPSRAVHTRLTDFPGKEWFPSLTPDGRFFVYARKVGDRSRLFLRQVGGATDVDLLRDSPAGDSQPAVSSEGQVAFRSERAGGGIFVMELMGESVRRVTTFGFNPAWSPDGREIVFATEGIEDPRIRRHPSQIYRVEVETGKRRLVHAGDAVQPSWSPNGLRIAYWSGFTPSGERVIWTVPAEGGRPVQVTTGESVDWNPVWSPDGRHLYFASDRSGITSLWRVPIDERTGRAGTPEPVVTSGQSMLLSFATDGRRLAYASDETRTTLEKVPFDAVSGTVAGPAVAITQTSERVITIDVSRDGRWLVYQTSIPREDLFVVRPDGSGLRRLTDDKFKDRQPRWSPDGTRIAFYADRGGKYEIWTIRADGSRLERVANLPVEKAFHPIWSPDGRWLACDLGKNEALIDLALPPAERRPHFLPPAEAGMGFSASSWSADGRWLAGSLHKEERQLPGIVLYSPSERRYVRVSERGQSATWLSDSRRLLYWDSGTFFLLDAVTRTSRPVLATPPGSDYNDFTLSPDNRFLYLARNSEQGDIWMLTME